MAIDRHLLDGKKHIHFIGIGGAGMFPLVQILHKEGYTITGSDNNESDTLQRERAMGIPVTLGHSPDNIRGADLIVHTAAIMDDNPELIAARQSGTPVIERSILLGYLSTCYPYAICVSGTHGKTTTTAMLTQMLLDAGLDPSAVIGGMLPSIGGNGRRGESDILVVEACEYVDTFLKLSPDVAILLNIDADHMEYFKTRDNVVASYRKFASMATTLVIAHGDDKRVMEAVENVSVPLITFGFDAHNDYHPAHIEMGEGVRAEFDLVCRGETLGRLALHVPGKHNILNAVAAVAAALEAGADFSHIQRSLHDFAGAGRRFEVLAEIGGITIADDYAHHPAELKVTLESAKGMRFKRVWAVFQPFTFSRTAMLLDDFAEVLQIPDKVVLSAIMGSREKNTYGIHTSDLAKKIPGAVWFETFEEIADYVCEHAQAGDLIITLGCGDIYKAAKLMIQKLQNR